MKTGSTMRSLFLLGLAASQVCVSQGTISEVTGLQGDEDDAKNVSSFVIIGSSRTRSYIVI